MVLHATVAGRAVRLDSEAVVRALRRIDPEPVRKHYVVVGSRKIPVRQALSVVTGIDKADFQSHQARSIFRRLGLPTGQLDTDRKSRPEPSLDPREQADELRPYRGRWVAVDENRRVIHAADSPLDVIAWLRKHGRTATSMFGVPLDPRIDMPRLIDL